MFVPYQFQANFPSGLKVGKVGSDDEKAIKKLLIKPSTTLHMYAPNTWETKKRDFILSSIFRHNGIVNSEWLVLRSKLGLGWNAKEISKF